MIILFNIVMGLLVLSAILLGVLGFRKVNRDIKIEREATIAYLKKEFGIEAEVDSTGNFRMVKREIKD